MRVPTTWKRKIPPGLDPGPPGSNPSGMSFFITGTDSGVGKTYVTCLLLQAMRAAGVDAVGYKPVACGDRDDALLLAKASGGLDPDEVNPVFLRSALAPMVACMLENQTIDPQLLDDGYRRLAGRHEVVLVEGAGGWEVPIVEGFRMSHFAAALGLPVMVVAGNRLGVLNHLVLTVNAIRSAGLDCAGFVLNQLGDELDTAMITNKGVAADLTGVPLLEHVIHGQDFIDLAAFPISKPATSGFRSVAW
jgi:dethiobiotin synthetase